MRDITPLPKWMNGFSATYSIWWMLCCHDWYIHTGNLANLLESKEYITELLRLLISRISPDGREHLNGPRFLDWPTEGNKQAKDVGIQALMVLAMQCGQDFGTIFNDPQLQKDCAAAEKLLAKPADKLYAEFLKSGVAPDAPGSKQAAALMTLAGLTNAKKADKDILSYNGGHGFSTFYGYIMLEAMARGGDWKGALDIIRNYWGAMLDLGATTFGKISTLTGFRMRPALTNSSLRERRIYTAISVHTAILVSAIACATAGHPVRQLGSATMSSVSKSSNRVAPRSV